MKLDWKKWINTPSIRFALGLLLPLFALTSIHSKKVESKRLEYRVRTLHAKNFKLNKLREREADILARMKGAPDNYFQAMAPFCEGETNKLKALVITSPRDASARERLNFLTHGNRIEFSEGARGELVLQQPIELDENDLPRLLSWIELIPIGSYHPPEKAPYMTIKRFDLSKNPISSNEETFLVNFTLLKHETPYE